jgi:hypothetical protein
MVVQDRRPDLVLKSVAVVGRRQRSGAVAVGVAVEIGL